MKHDAAIEGGQSGPRLSILAAAAAAIVLLAYTVTLSIAKRVAIGEALAGGAANMIPTILFGIAAYQLIRTRFVGRPLYLQLPGHLALGAAFALLSYWMLMVLLGVLQGASVVEFTVRPFPDYASAWQLLENATAYGVFAALAYADGQRNSVALILSDGSPSTENRDRGLSRYFIRSGDEIMPVDVEAIVSIAGADDYAEVVTGDGKHLVRMTLAEFEQALDATWFMRVHRSRIVNLNRIERAEPTGDGRMLLHMESGETIRTSRTGSRLLRERVL